MPDAGSMSASLMVPLSPRTKAAYALRNASMQASERPSLRSFVSKASMMLTQCRRRECTQGLGAEF